MPVSCLASSAGAAGWAAAPTEAVSNTSNKAYLGIDGLGRSSLIASASAFSPPPTRPARETKPHRSNANHGQVIDARLFPARHRAAVAEIDPLRIPDAAGAAGGQWPNRHLDLVAGLEGAPCPSAALQRGGAHALEVPGCGPALFSFYPQQQRGVRIGVAELLHGAFDLGRLVEIEHREGMMRGSRAAERDEHGDRQARLRHSRHRRLPLILLTGVEFPDRNGRFILQPHPGFFSTPARSERAMRTKPCLTLEDAHKMVEACRKAAAKTHEEPTVAVVDAGGHLLY